jgi:hypothetical protein
VFGGDAQRQRQARAQLRKFGEIGRSIPAAAGAGHLAHEGNRVGFLEDVEPDAVRAVTDRQPCQLVPARDDDERSGSARDQGTRLANVRHVVEQDEHPTIGDQRTEQSCPAVKVGRYRRRIDAQVPWEPVQHHLGRDGRALVKAAQVGIQLPVRELITDVMRPVQGQGGLADSRRAGNHDYRCGRDLRRRMTGSRGGREACQPPEFAPPVHEGADIGRQLTGDNLRVMRAVADGVEVDAPGDIARLHDIALHLGAADLAPYLTRTANRAF